jgi:histo-blood group ABO system transferase
MLKLLLTLCIIPKTVLCFKVGLLIVATGRYIEFIPPLIKSGQQYFLIDHEVTYFIFTDKQFHPVKEELKTYSNVTLLHQNHYPWPLSSILRYQNYLENKPNYENYDYLFSCDADMLFASAIDERILADSAAVVHTGFVYPKVVQINNSTYDEYHFEPQDWHTQKKDYPFEKNSFSAAYIDKSEYYFHACFFGGAPKKFFTIIETSYEGMKKDLKNNFLAVCHDESHLNRYFHDNPPALLLPPLFACPEVWLSFHKKCHRNFQPKICALTKPKDHFRETNLPKNNPC